MTRDRYHRANAVAVLVQVVFVAVALAVFVAVGLHASKKAQECESRGGVLVRGHGCGGWQCVEGVRK